MVGPWNLKVDQVEDMDVFEFLLQGKDFDSIHPSLQRQTILNMNYGLYEVLPNKIYQSRSYDLGNISVVRICAQERATPIRQLAPNIRPCP
jgi:alkyl sulfatase BDS1-like metallo-beta-lactamase superfamily hydrolase